MLQAFERHLWLYADDTCSLFQHKDITRIEAVLNKNFSMLCEWSVNINFSVHFGEDKTKSILLCSRHKIKNPKPLDIEYNGIKTKRFKTKILTSNT